MIGIELATRHLLLKPAEIYRIAEVSYLRNAKTNIAMRKEKDDATKASKLAKSLQCETKHFSIPCIE